MKRYCKQKYMPQFTKILQLLEEKYSVGWYKTYPDSRAIMEIYERDNQEIMKRK